jgi:hypothetical protein
MESAVTIGLDLGKSVFQVHEGCRAAERHSSFRASIRTHLAGRVSKCRSFTGFSTLASTLSHGETNNIRSISALIVDAPDLKCGGYRRSGRS